MRLLALCCVLAVMLCSSVAIAQGKSVMTVEIARVRRDLDVMPDRTCPSMVQANQDAYGALREYYHSLPRERTPLSNTPYDSIKGAKLPPRMSREDREVLDAFIEHAALHAARCAPELVDGGEQALSFWIHHSNTFLFVFVDPDIEQREIVERVLGTSLDSNQEALIERMMAQIEGSGDVRGGRMLVEAIARERAKELDVRLSSLALRMNRERERKQSYAGFLVGLTLFALVLVWFGTQLRPGFARVPMPRAPHHVWLPYKVRPEGEDEAGMLVSMRAWWCRLARFALRFGLAGGLFVAVGLGVIHHAFGVLGSDRGFVEVIGGWALMAIGVALLTHRLWYKPSEVLTVEGIARVRELDSHGGVLDVLETLEASYYAILVNHRSWLSFEPERDPMQEGIDNQDKKRVGQACAMLWKGMMRMRGRRPELPPLDYTRHIASAYASSKDEWGDALEAYWDALVLLDAPEDHIEPMQRAWNSRSWWQLGFGGAPLELSRLEAQLTQAMLAGRRWRRARWQALFFKRDVVREQARQLVWVVERGASRELFWVDESMECVTPDGEVVHIDEHAHIRLAHAADLSPAQFVEWGELLADHEFAPCMSQLDRYPESWDVPQGATWLILEHGELVHDTLPHEPSDFGVHNIGTLTPFDVMVFGYENAQSAGLAVIPLDDAEQVIALSSLPPVLYAELCFLLRHGVTSRAALQAFYKNVHILG